MVLYNIFFLLKKLLPKKGKPAFKQKEKIKAQWAKFPWTPGGENKKENPKVTIK